MASFLPTLCHDIQNIGDAHQYFSIQKVLDRFKFDYTTMVMVGLLDNPVAVNVHLESIRARACMRRPKKDSDVVLQSMHEQS